MANGPGTERTEFEIVARGAPKPRRGLLGRNGLIALFIVVTLAGAAVGSTLVVRNRADTSNLFAERIEVDERLVVSTSTIFPSKTGRTPLGVDGSPAEMASPLTTARTSLFEDEWVYSVTVQERSANSVPSGQYVVELFLDEDRLGEVHLENADADSAVVEGAKVQFAIGSEISTSSLYYVVIKPFVRTGPLREFVLKSSPSGDNTWMGVGGGIDAKVNPDLSVETGSTVKLLARNGDSVTHNIGIKDSAGTLLTPPGWSPDIEIIGDEQTISWGASTPGTYTYVCKYHEKAGMKGTLIVT